jgi:hypothetical protein
MSNRFTMIFAAVAAAGSAVALAITPIASGASSLPTINVALTGTTGITVSGSTVSGAVNIVSTFSGKAPSGHNSNGPSFGIVRLNPGVTIQQAAGAVQSHQGDINALDPYGALIVSASAPGTIQTTLTPGNTYVALNITGNGQPGFAPFTVTQSTSPAALPAAAATERSIEFGFRGPTVLHNGTTVRAENGGYLVHMITMFHVKDKATGRKTIALLKAGKDRQAERLARPPFLSLLNPASPGAMQQQTLNATPGYYIEACFMVTQDGHEHTRLGMERLVKIVK